MAVTRSLNDVLIFLLSVTGIVLLVYLASTLSNINSILKDVKYIVSKNKNNIDSTISSLPGIASNIQGITGEVIEGVQTIAATSETIEKKLANSAGSISDKAEITVDYVQIISELVKTGINYLSKRK